MLFQLISDEFTQFHHAMLQYILVIAPFICSLWALEAAQANASDVFIFWLAMGATLKSVIDSSETGIPDAAAKKVTTIFNRRYKEFFATNEIYFVAFMLDPRTCITLS